MAIDLEVSFRAPATARKMTDAARGWLASLKDKPEVRLGQARPTQLSQGHLPFLGDQRYRWDYRPLEMRPRPGLRLINMSEEQKAKALALVDAALSTRGVQEVKSIMQFEAPLRLEEQIENEVNYFVRDPEQYVFCVYGEPGGAAPWQWSAGGHHIGLHFTIQDPDLVTPVPLFFGSHPVQVKYGPQKGQRNLEFEEEQPRALVRSLDAVQRQAAVFSQDAPPDLLTDSYRVAYPHVLPRSLAYRDLSGEHRERLVKIIRHYVERTNEEIARNEWARLEQAGFDTVTFAWGGGLDRWQPHYYNICGPTFMVEYDNTQDGANHIHSIYRDFTNDWGEDMLAQHYAEAHTK